jgi:hypothetical protein
MGTIKKFKCLIARDTSPRDEKTVQKYVPDIEA